MSGSAEPKLQRLGRKKHPVLGDGVLVCYRTWDGGRGKEVWSKEWFPVRQKGLAKHPRCPTGYMTDFDQAAPDLPQQVSCVSPGCSFYPELCKYASFRWN